MRNYYNEFDPSAAAWLRELIAAGLIPYGDVDERSIEDVKPGDLRGYRQCHFFAGIGGWSHALELAGWPADRPVWTGSCPCQPFSSAGKGAGFDDQRHLWPAWMRLIATCKPPIIFGEQVASREVMGGSNKSMYSMRGGQTPESVQAIYRARKIWASSAMQGMPASLREIVAIELSGTEESSAQEKSRESGPVCTGISSQEQGALFGGRVQTKIGKERDSVRSSRSSSENSRAHEQRVLRGYRNALESRADVEYGIRQSVDRQDQSFSRIHLQEHSDRLLCGERNDGVVGRDCGFSGSEELGHEKGEVNDERRATGTSDLGADEEPARSWIDLVFNDLEGAGYACASAAFPAAGIGAPHIRDRAYWAAYSQRDQQSWAESCGRSSGRMGRLQQPIPWDEPWTGALARLRVLDDGLPRCVAATDAARNAIVPQAAAEFVIAAELAMQEVRSRECQEAA